MTDPGSGAVDPPRTRNAGRRTALAEAELVDDGRLLATATSSCLVVRPG